MTQTATMDKSATLDAVGGTTAFYAQYVLGNIGLVGIITLVNTGIALIVTPFIPKDHFYVRQEERLPVLRRVHHRWRRRTLPHPGQHVLAANAV